MKSHKQQLQQQQNIKLKIEQQKNRWLWFMNVGHCCQRTTAESSAGSICCCNNIKNYNNSCRQIGLVATVAAHSGLNFENKNRAIANVITVELWSTNNIDK